MNNKKYLEEYKYLSNEAKKIENNQTKTFCIHTLSSSINSIAIELISSSNTISSIYFGSTLYFNTKQFLKLDSFYYPFINHSLYKSSLTKYKIVIERIANIFTKSNELNPAFIAGIYHTLLTRGDFSYNRKNNTKNNQNQYILLPDKDKGIFLINGYSTNTYIPFHFKTLLKEIGIEAATLPVLFTKNIYKNLFEHTESKENIIIPQEIANLDNSLFPSILGNYQLNILKTQNKEQIYYIDIINEIFFYKATNKSLKLPNAPILKIEGFSKKEYILPIKLLGNKLYSTKENTDQAKELLKFNYNPDIETISNYQKGQRYVIDNSEIFEKLYIANQINYQEIANNLTLLEDIVKQHKENPKNKILKR